MFSFIGIVFVSIIIYVWLFSDSFSIKITINGKEKINYKKTTSKEKDKKEND